MKIQIKKYLQKELIRPIIYKTIVKLLCGVLAGEILYRYANFSEMRSRAFFYSGIFVLLAASSWFAFLRLDGVSLPRIRRKNTKKKQNRGGMLAPLYEPSYSYDELDAEQYDFCVFVSSLLCCIFFLVFSLLS